MAIFASTTTSGYSDPLKAYSIKALEARQKDLLAQQAAAPGITPENTQTPIQGFGHLANQLGDQFKEARSMQAVAEGRNEVAAVIAQGPQGPDGQYSPQQLAVMARRSPEFMEKLTQHQHDLKYQGNQIKSSEGINNANLANAVTTTGMTQAGGNYRAELEATTRKDVSASEQAAQTGRTSATLSSEEQRQRERLAADATSQGSKQGHDVNMARLQSELIVEQKKLEHAQQNNLADKAAEATENLARINSELRSGEERQKETFQKNQLETTISKDERLAGLERDLKREQLRATIAANNNDQKEKLAAEARQQELRLQHDTVKGELTREHEGKLQTQAEAAKAADLAKKIDSDERLEASKAAAKAASEAGDPTRVGKITEMGSTYGRFVQTTDRLERALKILDNGGINTGPWAKAETVAANLTNGKFGGSKEMAQRTIDFNNLVNLEHIKTMSNTLKGQTTNFEMEKFLEVLNNPNASPEERRTALAEAVRQAKLDRDLHRNAVAAVGGKPDTIDAHLGRKDGSGAPPPAAGGGGSAKPAGMDDAAILAEAQRSMANATPEQKAQIQQRLQSWGVKGL